MRSTLVIAALTLGFPTAASAQMKEGTYSGTYSGFGTYKAAAIGKERSLSTWDHNGLTLTDGFLDHVTWHCSGVRDLTNGMSEAHVHGYCVATDPAGDQLVLDVGPDEKTSDQKSWIGSGTLTSGTGKFAGVSGSLTYVTHGNEFRSGAEGTFVVYNTFEGRYKLSATEATGSTAPPTPRQASSLQEIARCCHCRW
jgi:hypothetical protein